MGAGLGQDSLFFSEEGFEVTCTDLVTSSLEEHLLKQACDLQKKIQVKELDLKNRFSFIDNAYDIVYAHLSLHYFDRETTNHIFNEVERVLRPGGILAFLTNSITDPEYNTGTYLEEDFFRIGKADKRYFSIESVKKFTRNFQSLLIDDCGETYKDRAKGIHHLIRYIGKKT